MESWKLYQEKAAQLFRELGCIVETDAAVQGARAQHNIDVWIRFNRFGVRQTWVIECKLWKRSIPKEKVLALKSIIEDVGADRGILIAESGHQPGARAVASLANITLTSLDELRQSATGDLLRIGLSSIFERAAHLKERAFSLYEHENWSRDGMHGGSSRPKPGVDGNALSKAIGSIATLQMGIEQAQLKRFPVPVRFDESGDKIIRASNLEEFVGSAATMLDELEIFVAGQHLKEHEAHATKSLG